MKLIDYLTKWNLESLRINTHFLNLEFKLKDADKKAAWEMYVELITRISTQELHEGEGDDKTALSSLYSLFGTTREIIKNNGPECIEFAKVAVVILNQVLRPFTSKWHQKFSNGSYSATDSPVFRKELQDVQAKIHNYTGLLSDFAGVENLLDLEP